MASAKDKLEFVGIVAVVVSLLFLGYEIRQNTDTSAAQAVFELNEAARQTLFLEATDPKLASLINKAEQDYGSLNELERYMYQRWVFANVNLFESAWSHHHRGVISDADMEGWKISHCGYMSRPSYRQVAQTFKVFSRKFSEVSTQWCQ